MEELKRLIESIESGVFDWEKHKGELLSELKGTAKKLQVSNFLVNKYKTDYNNNLKFLNQSIEEIEKGKEDLLKANIELERFAYVVSHDLKAPLRTILSFVGLIKDEIDGDKNDQVHTYFSFVEKATVNMQDLIRETLEYSKLNSGGIQINEVDLNNTLDSILDMFQTEIINSEVQIDFEPLPVIKANRAMMYKLFQNFIENGLKYNRSALKIIHIDCEENENEYVFNVMDNGIGIGKPYHDKVFQMYSRFHSSSEFEGTGMGLAICKKIIDNHKGTLRLESEVEKGTTFTFTINKALDIDC